MYSLYMHTTPSNKRYIGITSKEPKVRWNKGLGYKHNPHFWQAIQKYGWNNIDHEIILVGLSKEWACKIEQDLIRQYDTRNPQFGYNSSSGGESGSFGVKRSQDTINKLRLAARGRPSPMLGRHPSEEHIAKIVASRRKSDNFGKGRKLTEEHKKKIGDALRGKSLNLTEEQRQVLRNHKLGKNNPNYGKIWITNDEKSIQIHPEELYHYTNLGYRRGRKFAARNSRVP